MEIETSRSVSRDITLEPSGQIEMFNEKENIFTCETSFAVSFL